MKKLAALIIMLSVMQTVFGQDDCDSKFKKLYILSKKDMISQENLSNSLVLVKALETNHCSDYYKTNKKGEISIDETLTSLFGDICLKNNSQIAVQEYIKYMKRHHGSAEEQISFSFEKIFVKQPGYVLSTTGLDKDVLNQLAWGFLNNHYGTLTRKNYKVRFYQINPKVKAINPKYKKQIDYLLNAISGELKG